MEISKLILEYVKVLIWPAMLVIAFFSYEDKLFDIIENREIDAFGLKIGREIEDISENYEAQIAQLKDEMKKLNNSRELLEKVDVIENNLEKQLTHVKSSAFQRQTSLKSLNRKEEVAGLERKGFEALINKDIESAIVSFSTAQTLWPDYHNISEIKNLLVKNRENLKGRNSADVWKEVESVILKKYSWGMPKDIRRKLKDAN